MKFNDCYDGSCEAGSSSEAGSSRSELSHVSLLSAVADPEGVPWNQSRRQLFRSEVASADPRHLVKAHEARPLGGSGGMPPKKILNFRPSEIVSDAILG